MDLQLFAAGGTVLDRLRTPVVLNYVRSLPVEPYLGDELFPSRTVNELDYKYMVGANNLPVAATVIPFDSEAPVHSRDGLQFVEGRIPAIKRKIRLDEATMFKLWAPRQGTSDVDDAVAEIYDDVKLMTESVRAGIEMLRMRAVTTGKITIIDEETGARLEADYRLEPEQRVVCDGQGGNPHPWSDVANRDILGDIERWLEEAEDRAGVRPERIVLSRKVLNMMLSDAKIRDAVWNQASSTRPITLDDLTELFRRLQFPTQIAVYEKKVRVQAAAGPRSVVRLFPENFFVLLPGDKLGDTLFAPTVESLRKVREGVINFGDAAGIFGEIWETNDPPAHWTMAAALAFPTFPRANEIVIANVDPQ